MATTMARVASRGRLLQPRLALPWTPASTLLSVSAAPQPQPTSARQPAPIRTPSRSTSSSPSLSASPVRRQAEIEELLLSKLRSVQDPLLDDLPPSQAPNIVAQVTNKPRFSLGLFGYPSGICPLLHHGCRSSTCQ